MNLMNEILSEATIYPDCIHMSIPNLLTYILLHPSLRLMVLLQQLILTNAMFLMLNLLQFSQQIMVSSLSSICHQEYQQAEFTHYKVFCALKCLPSKYSRTPDGFPAGFLKSIAYAIAFPSSRLFTMSMDCRVYLGVGNRQLFVPFSKKGPTNYLVIIVPNQCLLQSNGVYGLWFNDILSRSNNLISKYQFGFLATCTQLLATLNEWTLFTGIKIDSVYIDFAKVFDSISHRKLLFKVECYGISPSLVRWLFSFQTARFQQVYIG